MFYIDKETGTIGNADDLLFIDGNVPDDIADAPDNIVADWGLQWGTPFEFYRN